MPTTDFNIDYFIAKFEAIPDEKWTTNTYSDSEGRCCAYGHCGQLRANPTDPGTLVRTAEANALRNLVTQVEVLDDYDSNPLLLVAVNDGKLNCRIRYPQTTPKARVLAFLRDVKAKLEANPS